MDERRKSRRVTLDSAAEQIVDDAPHRCRATNVSDTGVYLERPLCMLARRTNVVQVELELPGADAPVWAKAEVVYDSFDASLHGTALRFTAMASPDRARLAEWLAAH
jgi:hypothetical protein